MGGREHSFSISFSFSFSLGAFPRLPFVCCLLSVCLLFASDLLALCSCFEFAPRLPFSALRLLASSVGLISSNAIAAASERPDKSGSFPSNA